MKGSAALEDGTGSLQCPNLINSVLASPSVDYVKIELSQTGREREEKLREEGREGDSWQERRRAVLSIWPS